MAELHYELVQAAREYDLPPAAVELLKQSPPLIIAGVTASGKDVVADQIESEGQYKRVITHTTRKPRQEEKSGVDYWFVSEQEMLDLLNSQSLIEAKVVHDSQVSAISLSAYQTVLQSGHKPLLIIDVQGIQDITGHLPDLKPIFILPPSFEEWMHRLEKRGSMTNVEKIKRLKSARHELDVALKNPHFDLVINKDIPAAADEILREGQNPTLQYKNRELIQQLIDQIEHL